MQSIQPRGWRYVDRVGAVRAPPDHFRRPQAGWLPRHRVAVVLGQCNPLLSHQWELLSRLVPAPGSVTRVQAQDCRDGRLTTH